MGKTQRPPAKRRDRTVYLLACNHLVELRGLYNNGDGLQCPVCNIATCVIGEPEVG